jgi:hypothetical protein
MEHQALTVARLPDINKWVVKGGTSGWIFLRRFPAKWKAETAIGVWQAHGRVSDYLKAIKSEKAHREKTQLQAEYRRREAIILRLRSAGPLSPLDEETPITIVRQPGHYGWANVPLRVLNDFHFRETTGGVGRILGRQGLFARVLCDNIPAERRGVFGHSCAHGPGPHEILVYIGKATNRSVYERLVALT